MLEINDGYNKLKIEIKNYTDKSTRISQRIDEDESWCDFSISIKNEYVELENSYYDLKNEEVDYLYEMLNNFTQNKMNDNCSFEPLEPSFKVYFYPFGEEYKNNNYIQNEFNTNDKILRLFICFVEKSTMALCEDGVSIVIDNKSVEKITEYFKKIQILKSK